MTRAPLTLRQQAAAVGMRGWLVTLSLLAGELLLSVGLLRCSGGAL